MYETESNDRTNSNYMELKRQSKMNEQEKYVQMMARLVGELLGGIDAGNFVNVEMIPEKYTYGHLCALFRLSHVLDNGVVLYEQIYDLAMKCGEAAIRKKIQKGEKIKIAFLAISAAEWPAEEVYQRLKKDARCESYIVVCPLVDRDKDDMKQVYRQTCHFFEQKGHEVRKAYDEETEECFAWEKLDITFAYRLAPTKLLQSINWEELKHPFFLETALKPIRLGVKIHEIPSQWSARQEGESQNSFLQTFKYLKIAFKVKFERKGDILKTNV